MLRLFYHHSSRAGGCSS